MRILIINDAFYHSFMIGSRISWRLYNFLQFYKRSKLNRLITRLIKNYGNNVKIKVITADFRKLSVHKNVEVELLSDYRLNLDRDIFLKIQEKIKQNTKCNLATLLYNLRQLKNFQIENIPIGESLEFHLIWFLNEVFGEYELIKMLLQEKYDKFIFINQKSVFKNSFKFLSKKFQNIEICQDPFLKRINNLPKLTHIKYYFRLLKNSISFSIKSYLKNNEIFNNKKKSLVFVCNSANQFNGIKKIYTHYRLNPDFNSYVYKNIDVIPINKLNKLMKFLFLIKNTNISPPLA